MVYTCERQGMGTPEVMTLLGIISSTDFERRVREQLYKEQGQMI